ncbi:hypothetical protein MPH_09516 [Macrophomina phaseolina MS6]|uniref:Uncharacterized protein n=1 Tax=Macrophomina phaseolina (strain MS6) TaxID=1126212 RepID=K2QTZ7_MACPH|nr:hypothetical protein MPH_09516 [Macrophomina phaseolina MS6]
MTVPSPIIVGTEKSGLTGSSPPLSSIMADNTITDYCRHREERPHWLFDGNKIWCLKKTPDCSIEVDLDVKRGRQARPDPKGKKKQGSHLHCTKKPRFGLLACYLVGKAVIQVDGLEA